MELVNSDIQLINLKDEKAFENIFKTYYASLASFAMKYVKEPALAEEIVQEMFSNMWIRHETLRVQTSLKSYLYGAVRNACLNYIKHQKVAQKYADRTLLTARQEDATDFLELDELKEKIGAAMDKIPEKCREIFELNRFEGLRYKEIADQLNLSLKTVENQMGKALKILRDELGDYLPIALWLIAAYGPALFSTWSTWG